MIDTHCHLLPGLDDGPDTEAESLDLARAIVADGIERVVCTPHYSSMFPTDDRLARERHSTFKSALERERISLRIDLAAEIGPGYAVSAPFEELERRLIGNRFLLVEAQPDVSASFFFTVVERLQQANMRVVFAHPERARSLGRHLSLVDELRRAGCLIQVVAPSLLDRWGPGVGRRAWRLVDTGRADIVGSDAHGVTRRRVHLQEVAQLIDDRLGRAVATLLTEGTPRRVLEGAEPG